MNLFFLLIFSLFVLLTSCLNSDTRVASPKEPLDKPRKPTVILQSSQWDKERAPAFIARDVPKGEYIQLFKSSDCTDDSEATTKLRVGENPYEFNSQNLGEDGLYTFAFRQAKDEVSLEGAECIFVGKYELDTTPPQAPTAVTIQGGGRGPNPRPIFKVEGLESLATVELFSDASCDTPRSRPVKIAEMQEGAELSTDIAVYPHLDKVGSYSFYAQQTDRVGHESPCSTAKGSYTFDTPIPSTPHIALVTPSPYHNPNPIVLLNDLEVEKFAYVFKDSACTEVVSERIFTEYDFYASVKLRDLSDDTYTFYAQVFDIYGQKSACSAGTSTPYILDTVPPSRPTRVVSLSGERGHNQTPQLRVEGIEGGIEVQLFTDQSCDVAASKKVLTGVGDTSVDITVTPLEESKSYSFYARQIDLAQNLSPCSSVYATYELDNFLPISGVSDDTNPTHVKRWSWWSNREAKFRYALTQNASHTFSSEDAYEDIQWAVKSSADGTGDHYFHVQGQDLNARESNVVSVLVKFMTLKEFKDYSLLRGRRIYRDISGFAFADLDGDNKLDLVVGKPKGEEGELKYFKNQRDARGPILSEQKGDDDIFADQTTGADPSPLFMDYDSDGDLDLLVATQDGTVQYFKNEGDRENPLFTEKTGSDNPLDGLDFGSYPVLSRADLSNDGGFDLVVGQEDGTLLYFEHSADADGAQFIERTGADNPFGTLDAGDFSAPTFAQINGDESLDLVVGNDEGAIEYYEASADSTEVSGYIYVEKTGDENPFENINMDTHSFPVLADLSGDGSLELILVNKRGRLSLFEEGVDENNDKRYFISQSHLNPLGKYDFGENSVPSAVSLNDDDLGDLVVRDDDGDFNYLESSSDSSSLTGYFYELKTDSDNPFDSFQEVGASLTFTDLSGDGFMDLITGGESGGGFTHFETSSDVRERLGFSYKAGSTSGGPLSHISLSGEVAAFFADISGDSRSELLVGEDGGDGVLFHYYEASVDSTEAFGYTYVEKTGDENPFADLSLPNPTGSNTRIKPILMDVDGDRDLDLIAGYYGEGLAYFKNEGNDLAPLYEKKEGKANPFSEFYFYPPLYSEPALIDLDGDGDLDLVVGSETGKLLYGINFDGQGTFIFID